MKANEAARTDCLSALENLSGVHVRRDIKGAALTTFNIGGPLAFVIEAGTIESLQGIILAMKRFSQPYRVLGAGSNLLISDEGLDGWVIRLGAGFREVRESSCGIIEAGASASLMGLSRDLSDRGMCGLEFAGGIPASIGGAMRMNAGAHGGQMADVVSEVQLIDAQARVQWLKAEELTFSYRRVNIPEEAVITAVRFQLESGDAARSSSLRVEYLARRKATQPLSAPSAGSVFRNPSSEKPAGWLIEQAGLKGQKRGGARISELHANWIVNEGRRACAKDVAQLMELCQSEVAKKFGLKLEPEIIRW